MVTIAEGAKCVFQGIRFDIYQREQKQFDGSYRTFECVKRFDSVQGVLIDWDKICIPEEIQPWWNTKKIWLWWWVLEVWEEPIDAMRREFLEETWFSADISYRTNIWSDGYVKRDEHFFLLKNPKKITEPVRESWESIALKYFSFDEFIQVVSDVKFRNRFFADYIIRTYILPGKLHELQSFLFI